MADDDDNSIMSTTSSPTILVIRPPPESYVAFWDWIELNFPNYYSHQLYQLMTQTFSCDSLRPQFARPSYYWTDLQNADH
jgi:hypothetical protein